MRIALTAALHLAGAALIYALLSAAYQFWRYPLDLSLSLLLSHMFMFLITLTSGPGIILQGGFALASKVAYLGALAAALCATAWGLRKRRRWWGHALSLGGLLAWSFLGILGLGQAG